MKLLDKLQKLAENLGADSPIIVVSNADADTVNEAIEEIEILKEEVGKLEILADELSSMLVQKNQ